MNRTAIIRTLSWAGVHENPCRVVGETPARYRIEVDKPTGLPPRFSILMPGQQKLVPKSAVLFTDEQAP
jgi:alcohol dehydrogenase YqhD (iron-dependent ADH family)